MKYLLTELPSLSFQARSEEQLASEKAFLEAERVWLVHKDGFAAAGLLKSDENAENRGPGQDNTDESDGKVRVQLDYNGDIIVVEEDDVEKANPPSFDKVEDLAQLRYLNESSVLHTIRQRYGSNLVHTYAGPTMIDVNPMTALDIYSEKVIHMFKECRVEEMPPHVYSVAAGAHHAMLTGRKDQSVAFIGRSGSGKSCNARHCLAYYSTLYGGKLLTPDRVAAVGVLLEAFGNARTIVNANATRFSALYGLDFDAAGQIVSSSVQTMLLEKSRVVRRPDGEPNFNVFYHMLAGLDARTRKDLYLDNLNEPNLFMTPLTRAEDRSKAAAAWSRVVLAAQTLDISASEVDAVTAVLAAIYHLGVASVARGQMGKTQFAKPQAAQKAAYCLGTNVEELTRVIFQGNTSSSNINRKLRSAEKDSANLPDGIVALEGFVIGLYQEVFNAVVFLVNRAISTTSNAHNTIQILDAPGFQNPSTCGRYIGATFEDLCHNYVQERLQLMFHERTISSILEKYQQEDVECDMDDLQVSHHFV